MHNHIVYEKRSQMLPDLIPKSKAATGLIHAVDWDLEKVQWETYRLAHLEIRMYADWDVVPVPFSVWKRGLLPPTPDQRDEDADKPILSKTQEAWLSLTHDTMT